MNTNPYRFISRPAIMILLAALASPGRFVGDALRWAGEERRGPLSSGRFAAAVRRRWRAIRRVVDLGEGAGKVGEPRAARRASASREQSSSSAAARRRLGGDGVCAASCAALARLGRGFVGGRHPHRRRPPAATSERDAAGARRIGLVSVASSAASACALPSASSRRQHARGAARQAVGQSPPRLRGERGAGPARRLRQRCSRAADDRLVSSSPRYDAASRTARPE